jgi:hypothetical protein
MNWLRSFFLSYITPGYFPALGIPIARGHGFSKEDRSSAEGPVIFSGTFLTRLGQSGCDAWTLARIAGHRSIAISTRYVHPSEDTVLPAMLRLGGQSIGQSETTIPDGSRKRLLTQ